MYNVKHRFIFVEVPRTGTTSIGRTLTQNLPFDYSKQDRSRKAVRHAPISELRHRPYLQGFRSFGFCRDPFARAVSLFAFGRPETPLPSVEGCEQFTAFLTHRRATYAYPFIPSFQYLSEDGRLVVDRVGCFERLHEDFSEICAWLGVGELELPHLNASKFPAHYTEYYTPAARDLVLYQAAVDFEQFGYDTTFASIP